MHRAFYKRDSQGIAIVVVLFLIIRIPIVYYFGGDESNLNFSDQGAYMHLSKVLLQGYGLGSEFGAMRMPLYPMFVSSILSVFDNYYAVLVVQELLQIVAIYYSWKIAKKYGNKIAIISATLAACSLGYAVHGSVLLTESIVIPIVTVALYNLQQMLYSHKLKFIVYFAICIALLNLVRPTFHYIAILSVFFFFIKGLPFRKKVIFSIIFISLVELSLGVWKYRNYIVYGHFDTTVQHEVHLIGWILPHIDQYEHKQSISKSIDRRKEHWGRYISNIDNFKDLDDFERNEVAKKYSISVFIDYKLWSIIQAGMNGALRNIFSPSVIDLLYYTRMEHRSFYETEGAGLLEQGYNFLFKNTNNLYTFLLLTGILITGIIRLISLLGLIFLYNKDREFLYATLVFISYVLIISGPIGYAKYRIPFEPILILYTSIGLIVLRNRFSNNKTNY